MSENNTGMLDSGEITLGYDKENSLKVQLKERLKKAFFGGYTKKSVEQYAMEMMESTTQMRENFEQQIRTLSAECAKLNGECDVLRKQIQQAESDNEKIRQILDVANQENQELKEQLQDLREAKSLADEYQGMIFDLQQELQKKTELAASSKEEIAQLQDKLRAAMTQTEKLNQDLVVLQEQAAQAEQARQDAEQTTLVHTELDRVKAAYEDLKKKNEQLQLLADQNTALQNDLETVRGQLADQQKAHEGVVYKLSQQETAYTEELRKATDNTAAAKADTERLERKYGQLYDQYVAALGRIEQVATEKGAIERLLKKYQAREQEVAVLQEENTELKSAVSQLQQVCEEMLKEMERQQSAYQRVSSALIEKDAEINKLNTEKVELQMRNVQIMDQFESLAKGQTQITEKRLLAKETKQEDSLEMQARPFSSPNKSDATVDMNHLQEILARAKELGGNYTA